MFQYSNIEIDLKKNSIASPQKNGYLNIRIPHTNNYLSHHQLQIPKSSFYLNHRKNNYENHTNNNSDMETYLLYEVYVVAGLNDIEKHSTPGVSGKIILVHKPIQYGSVHKLFFVIPISDFHSDIEFTDIDQLLINKTTTPTINLHLSEWVSNKRWMQTNENLFISQTPLFIRSQLEQYLIKDPISILPVQKFLYPVVFQSNLSSISGSTKNSCGTLLSRQQNESRFIPNKYILEAFNNNAFKNLSKKQINQNENNNEQKKEELDRSTTASSTTTVLLDTNYDNINQTNLTNETVTPPLNNEEEMIPITETENRNMSDMNNENNTKGGFKKIGGNNNGDGKGFGFGNLKNRIMNNSIDSESGKPENNKKKKFNQTSSSLEQTNSKRDLSQLQKTVNTNTQTITRTGNELEKNKQRVKQNMVNIESNRYDIDNDEFECRPEDIKDKVETYNIEVGSSFSGLLSTNTQVRFISIIFVMTMIILLQLFVGPLIYGFFKYRYPNKAGGYFTYYMGLFIFFFLTLAYLWRQNSGAVITFIGLSITLISFLCIVLGTKLENNQEIINGLQEIITSLGHYDIDSFTTMKPIFLSVGIILFISLLFASRTNIRKTIGSIIFTVFYTLFLLVACAFPFLYSDKKLSTAFTLFPDSTSPTSPVPLTTSA